MLALVERNAWLGTELSPGSFRGVIDIGGGLEHLWGRGLLRSSLAFGVSVLAADTELHAEGTMGLFFEVRPVHLRWSVHPRVTVELSPLGLMIVAPVLRSPRLAFTQYRDDPRGGGRAPMIRAVALLSLLALPSTAHAFGIGSAFSDPCHEEMTAQAFEDAAIVLPRGALVVPEGDRWRRVGRVLVEPLGIDPATLSDEDFFILTSVLVGVRSPDTNGHSILNLENARTIHTSRDPGEQYAHALRGVDDDDALGDAAAVEGTRERIREEVELGGQALLDGEDPFERVNLYFDFYGLVDIRVWRPAYHLGRAAHAVQDSFSHTIRDEADELRTILTVFNYVEAVTGTLRESRDGIPHSNGMDDCGEATVATRAAARQATTELFLAARDVYEGRDAGAVEVVLDDWVTYRPGCTLDDAFCDNGTWLELARKGPAEPLPLLRGELEGRIGNARAPPGHGARRRLRSPEETAMTRIGPSLALLLLLSAPGLLAPATACAEPLLARERVEGWAVSVDVGSAVLSPLFGDDLRRSVTSHEGAWAHYRWREWSLGLRVSHTLWRIAEGEERLTQHALNLALGVERIHPSGFIRFALFAGSSTLLRANSLDRPGKTGIFLDLRPIGLIFDLGGHWTVGVDPLHVALLAPVLSGVPLVDIQFRTSLFLECALGAP